MPSRTEGLKVFTATLAFWMAVNYLIGYSHTPSPEHLYSWTALWMSGCLVFTHFYYPWPFVGGTIAWTGVIKNSGMLWGSYPLQGSRPRVEGCWPPWIAGLVVTALAAGVAHYRLTTAQWNRNVASRSSSLDDEKA